MFLTIYDNRTTGDFIATYQLNALSRSIGFSAVEYRVDVKTALPALKSQRSRARTRTGNSAAQSFSHRGNPRLATNGIGARQVTWLKTRDWRKTRDGARQNHLAPSPPKERPAPKNPQGPESHNRRRSLAIIAPSPSPRGAMHFCHIQGNLRATRIQDDIALRNDHMTHDVNALFPDTERKEDARFPAIPAIGGKAEPKPLGRLRKKKMLCSHHIFMKIKSSQSSCAEAVAHFHAWSIGKL